MGLGRRPPTYDGPWCPACGPEHPLEATIDPTPHLVCRRCGGAAPLEPPPLELSSEALLPLPEDAFVDDPPAPPVILVDDLIAPTAAAPLEARRSAPRRVYRPSPSVAPRLRRSRTPAILLVLALGAGAGAWSYRSYITPSEAPPVVVALVAPPAPLPEVAAAPADAGAPADAAAPAEEARHALLGEMVFGGRTPRWWQQRLDALYRAGQAEQTPLYVATRSRIERMGFVVEVGPGSHALEATPELIRSIHARRRR